MRQHKCRRAFALALALVLALTACGGSTESEQVTPTPTAQATATPSPTPEPTPTPDPIQAQIDAMTTEQKVGQLLVAGMEGAAVGADAQTAVTDYQVGGIILFQRNVSDAAQLAALNSSLNRLNDGYIPLFLCVDEEGGLVSRMPAEVTDLPSMYTYGKTGDTELARRVGQALAAQCSAFGFLLDFAPVLDVWSNPDNTVIGTRAFGSDAQTVAQMGTAVMAGLWESGVAPVVKHFPGHGDTAVDSHYGLPVVTKTVDELEELELIPFRAAIEAGAPAVMVAHILMTALDSQYPASLSPAVVDGLLRTELGFDGVVCTDDLTMAAVSDTWGMGEAAVLAVEAGCDLLLVCHGADNLTAARAALLDAVNSGRISQARLEESVYRILSLKAACDAENRTVETPDISALNDLMESVLPS
jgi:beta-N-acetylhexosaminidase